MRDGAVHESKGLVPLPFFSAIVLFKSQPLPLWFLEVFWKEGSLERMGNLPRMKHV